MKKISRQLFALLFILAACKDVSTKKIPGPVLAAEQPAVAQQSANVQQVLRNGCYTASQMQALYTAALNDVPDQSVTYRNMKTYFSSFADGVVSRMAVSDAGTWCYRAYYDATVNDWHVLKLKAGILYSKAQNRVDKILAKGGTSTDVAEFWETNGPELLAANDGPRNATFILMRLLAIQTSDTPPSQFVSVALSYDVAKPFGQVVYAFQVNPNSNILGLKGCSVTGGEVQFQILGGTAITNLHRKKTSGSVWEKYNQSADTWTPVSGSFPPQ